ncbi:ADP-ribosylglycohydrolase family protein [Amycolatopsis sp. cg5]|uniref:ADP-ribosylglycohydrolase family protein n=1 Tax=Amycolatopsis sp. cg5 TaxID=3238802 RepID=UPI0035232E7B
MVKPPSGPWEWTDDTEMACTLVAELRDHGRIDRDRLAKAFADRCEPYRGYGPGAVVILHAIRDGVPWREAAGAAFHGQGSCGNGAAMRVAPLGAYFAEDLETLVEQAKLSAEVTHLHPEGIAGAVAVALAAARVSLGEIPQWLDDGDAKRGIARAAELGDCSVAEAAYELGNGARAMAQDTVPFALWVAARFADDYPTAITACVEAGGDVDTTGAIVGGIVTAGGAEIPGEWLNRREALPEW